MRKLKLHEEPGFAQQLADLESLRKQVDEGAKRLRDTVRRPPRPPHRPAHAARRRPPRRRTQLTMLADNERKTKTEKKARAAASFTPLAQPSHPSARTAPVDARACRARAGEGRGGAAGA